MAAPRPEPTDAVRVSHAPERIPLLRKLLFGLGCGNDYLSGTLVTSILWMPVFNLGLGMSPSVLGAILMFFQIWSALVVPVAGYLSDNLTTRWGRRRPVIVVSAIVVAAVFPFLWHLPMRFSEAERIAYLVVVGVIFSTASTVWTTAYYAFQLELTPNYDERTRIAGWLAIFSKVAQLAGGWVLALVTGPWFTDPTTGRPDIVTGVRVTSWFVAGIILLTGIIPGLVLPERVIHRKVAPAERQRLWGNLKECANNLPLWLLVGASFFLVIASVAVANLWQYLNIYLVNGGDLAGGTVVSGWRSTAIFGLAIACVPLWAWLSERFDKRQVTLAMVIAGLVGHALNYFFIRAGHPYLQLVPTLLEAAAISAVWMFLPSMRADLVDYDELITGRRREGMLNAFSTWFNKIAFMISAGISGVVLTWSGFSAKAANQPPAVLAHMKLLYIAIPLVMLGSALAFLWFYPLGRERMAAIRAELEARRGQA